MTEGGMLKYYPSIYLAMHKKLSGQQMLDPNLNNFQAWCVNTVPTHLNYVRAFIVSEYRTPGAKF
jgi:uncharacterized protein YfbU (UPF0304 family)